MNRRNLFALPITVACLALAGSNPAGQHRPSVSADLADHAKQPHLHRVIVQADGAGLGALRRGLSGVVRRDLGGAVAVEVNDAQLEALQHNPLYQHISGDLPVVAHMAITNKVTAATAVWQGTPGLLGLLGGTPGYLGGGVCVAVLDSGMASQTALDTRGVAHVYLVSSAAGVMCDVCGPGTHIAEMVGGNRTAAQYV